MMSSLARHIPAIAMDQTRPPQECEAAAESSRQIFDAKDEGGRCYDGEKTKLGV